MYYIDSVSNTYNYEENVVLTKLFAKSEDGKDLFEKPISQDKTVEEMSSFIQQWSLTTLSVITQVDGKDLQQRLGKPFKRCYVRMVTNKVVYLRDELTAHLYAQIDVSLDADFAVFSTFYIDSENSLTEDFVKELQIKSLAGFKSI